MYLQGGLGQYGEVSWRIIVWQGSEWLILGALTPITYYLGRRFPLRGPHLARSVVAHVVGALVLCMAWAAAGGLLRLILGAGPDGSLELYFASWMLTSLPWSVFMYFTVLGCVYAFSYWTEAREREAQAARLSAQLAEARLGALRMQLNPHFLFNSLNALNVLVRDARHVEATRMLELLSEVLRQVLRTDQPHEIALEDELNFLRQYLAIEQVRFSDRLRVAFVVDDTLLDAAVPGFVLQPLVENALRHGVAKKRSAGSLEIGAKREDALLRLWVRDDGPGLDPASREGVGLANTRERLRTLYGDEGALVLSADQTGTIATIRVPLRRMGSAEPSDA
jgi:LytS/YehU family sensor histidine kinase